jgi:hypothetical protein
LLLIENSDPALKSLKIQLKTTFDVAGCRILARALLLNTRITSLDLHGTMIGPAGACVLFPALTHLTAMTLLNLGYTGLESSGASDLCHVLAHLSALTELYLHSNKLTADDGARICGAAAAAGMTRLKKLHLLDNGFSVSSVVGCEAWKQLDLPQLSDAIVSCATFLFLMQYVISSDRASFCETHHPALHPHLLRRIESNDDTLTRLDMKSHWTSPKNLGAAGCRMLSRALLLNTRITSLDLHRTMIGPAGACVLFPALTHLTAMTLLNLGYTGLGSSGASDLCHVLAHLSALTELDLQCNNLTADDGARICGAAAAAGMTRLKNLHLLDGHLSVTSVVGCEAWKQLNLPLPPDEIVKKCHLDYALIINYLLSEDKVASYTIRIFVVGESTVHPLCWPQRCCSLYLLVLLF